MYLKYFENRVITSRVEIWPVYLAGYLTPIETILCQIEYICAQYGICRLI